MSGALTKISRGVYMINRSVNLTPHQIHQKACLAQRSKYADLSKKDELKFSVEEAIILLKSEGYKIQKPVVKTEYEEI